MLESDSMLATALVDFLFILIWYIGCQGINLSAKQL